jgi:hypothetical protein
VERQNVGMGADSGYDEAAEEDDEATTVGTCRWRGYLGPQVPVHGGSFPIGEANP